jgi:hypothetical protein
LDPAPESRSRLLAVAGLVLAFLAIDLVWIAHRLPHPYDGDEWRYVYYARNLLHGFFSPRDRVFLWNGPGYPILLMPFVKAGWVDGARYANAFWHAGALVYAWLILRRRLSFGWTLGAVAVLGAYAPLFEDLPLAQTEVLSYLLTTAWIHHSLAGRDSRAHRVVAGVVLAMLILTKVVFGVVLTALLLVLLVVWLVRRNGTAAAFLQQGVLAALLCLPWLVYTHAVTGRFMYWSSAGPMSFYWLTAPAPNEVGDWYHHGWVYRNATLRAHHKAVFDEVTGLARDPHVSFEEQMFNACTPEAADVFAREGLKNVRAHPGKYLRNWLANISRLFLDVPTSVRGIPFWNQYSLAHLPLLAWTLAVLVIVARRRVPPPPGWWPIDLFLLFSFGVYSLNAAFGRFTVPLVPLWWLSSVCWLAEARRPT